MELHDFISQTIGQIIKGVKIAQNDDNNNGAIINPASINYAGNTSSICIENTTGRPVQIIKFDIGLTASSQDGSVVGAGIFVAAFSLGSKLSENSINSIVHRHSFEIPIALPNPIEK